MAQLTQVQVETILNRSSKILCGFFCPDDMLITLLAEGAVKRNDVTRIKKMDTSADKVQALLNKLAEPAVSSYESFMSALLEERPDLHARVLEIQKELCGKDVPNVPNPVNPPANDEYGHVAPDAHGSYTDKRVKRATPTDEQLNTKDNYDMKSRIKGLAYILNIRERRPGSDVDFRNMQHLFKELGYEISPHENLTAREIRQTVGTFVSKFDDSDSYLSAVVVLMSHGSRGYIVGADDNNVPLKDIQAEFRRCQNLKGKPKLFFIQACRGRALNVKGDGDIEIDVDDADFAKDIPGNADMYFAYATPEGYVSLRNNIEGSCFIQAITEVFLSHAHEKNLDSLMNMVTQRVSKEDHYWKKKNVTAKQTPEVVKRMTKALYFLPKFHST